MNRYQGFYLMMVLGIATSCKPASHLQLDDYAIGKSEYLAEIINGSAYIYFDAGVTGDAGTGGDAADVTARRAQNLQRFREIMNGPKEINGEINYNQDWYLAELNAAAIDQLKYSITGLSQAELGAAFSKLEITSYDVPDQPDVPKLPFIKDPEKYMEVTFSAQLTIQAPIQKQISSPPQSWAPIVVHDDMAKRIYDAYRPCVNYPGDDPEFYVRGLFYYFDTNQCDMQALNAEHKLFKPVQFKLTKKAAVSDGGRPEYDKIWEDDKLVATFVFGVNEAFSTKTKPDHGTIAYHTFLNSLSGIREMRRSQLLSSAARNYRGIYKIVKGDLRNKQVDIQAIHVEDIGEISPEQAHEIFGANRIGKHDLFVYNGHAGYGHNIEHVQKLLSPASDEYVLFFLNGCNTYSYNNLKNDNLDVLSNMKPARFTDLARGSIAVLQGLVRQNSYRTILGRLPAFQSAIVSGEDRQCPDQ